MTTQPGMSPFEQVLALGVAELFRRPDKVAPLVYEEAMRWCDPTAEFVSYDFATGDVKTRARSWAARILKLTDTFGLEDSTIEASPEIKEFVRKLVVEYAHERGEEYRPTLLEHVLPWALTEVLGQREKLAQLHYEQFSRWRDPAAEFVSYDLAPDDVKNAARSCADRFLKLIETLKEEEEDEL